jgi:hypothetical protein
MSKQQIRDSVSKTVADLQEEERQAFLSFHNAIEDEDGVDMGRVRTNAFALGSSAAKGGIFLKSCQINHSCNPNAQSTWNENLKQLTIHAIRDIVEGEEITIFYLPFRGNRSSRMLKLQAKFRFTCSCSLCSLPINQCKLSDERLDEIQRLEDSIGDAKNFMPAPLRTLHDVRKLLNLLDEEGIADESAPKVYYDAFQIVVTHGDVARATVFAKRAASL